ncbi:MAG: helix-hairpin-helix domain-containing protein [Bacteroidales bacterium]|nr:helix-hairpin-helix domain-containing protein [Bacteroidales bacterium]
MDPFREFFRDWFGYSRRERRSTFILLISIVVITGIRYLFPIHDMPIRELPVSQEWLLQDSTEVYLAAYKTAASGSEQEQTRRPVRQRQLDLNTCDSASLEAFPGIGPILAARIIKFRKLIGGYASIGQLREVYGLPEETFVLISGRVTADSLDVIKIRINTAGYGDLIRHPYFKKNEVPAILKYRELSGRINGVDELVSNGVISAETARRLTPYLGFD